jgi:hypothetical protein
MNRTRLWRRGGVALAAVGLIGLATAGAGYVRSDANASATACPTGFELVAEHEAAELRGGAAEADDANERTLAANLCINAAKHPEKVIELIRRQEGLESVRSAPYDRPAPGAFGAALAASKKMPKTDAVAGTSGKWESYGKGPLQVDHPDYERVNGLGLVDNMGRLDSLAYDPVNKRLFAAKGTGGIWLSENLGDSWRSIGDNLPSQIVGAVGWTPANGGTVVAISGDGTYGSGGYTGYGAFWSSDLGATWTKATGVPDAALGFAIEVDATNPLEVYAGTSFGLFRSIDGGKTYTNVNLPTGECSGVAGGGSCALANMVTDVAIKAPGGVNPNVAAGTVVAAVGWRAGARKNADGTEQSPYNGLYRSTSGSPNTFVKLGASGFTPQERIGRIEFGSTTGSLQDHDYLYAIVQDAAALNGQLDIVDASGVPDPRGSAGSVVNGVYVSSDFGATWTKMADDQAIAKDPSTGSALVGTGTAIGYEPGVQAWYNEWIAPDPTRQTAAGVPTRLAFGLEEVWQNELNVAQDGPSKFKVIGRYFSGESCMLLNLGLPSCPTHREPTTSNTTHPDQQEGLWIPDGTGGVTLAVGNDGGFYKQHTAATEEMDNGGWGDGNQEGFSTLLPYDVAMANDGTVWAGLQDNGHMKIDPQTREQFETFGGDGTFAEVDPTNPDIAYEAYVYGEMAVTTDGGKTWRDMIPPISNARFVNPFEMDPTDENHLVTGGNEVVETIYGPETTGATVPPVLGDPTGGTLTTCCGDKPWTKVYDLGTYKRPGDSGATPSATDPANGVSAIDTIGQATYVGYCGLCDILNAQAPFNSGIATNVGGDKPAKRMQPDGWHIAAAEGLPDRFITSVAIDPSDATKKTVYVTLGGYSRRWVPPGSLGDQNANVGEGHVFKSTNAGQSFTDVSGNLPDVPATWITLRGKQLIVGTDVGVFATDPKGKPTYAFLNGLPVVPISTMNLKPDDPNLLAVATYGRGIWTYCFADAFPGTVGGCEIKPLPPIPPPTAPVGETLGGPYGFELGAEGWTTTSSDAGVTAFRHGPWGNVSAAGFAVAPTYAPLATATLVSPTVPHPGGWAFVDFANKRNTEGGCGCDVMVIEYSSNGGATWKAAHWRWDADANDWARNVVWDGMNASYPAFDSEKAAILAPAGTLTVRFRFTSDQLVQLEGTYVDDVKIMR